MHAIICISACMNLMLFIIKFIKFKPIIKFKKDELHNCGCGYCGILTENSMLEVEPTDQRDRFCRGVKFCSLVRFWKNSQPQTYARIVTDTNSNSISK